MATANGNGLRLRAVSRRRFLGFAGLLAGAAFLPCSLVTKTRTSWRTERCEPWLGDAGILNYAYALERLEAAFYTQVIATAYSGLVAGSDEEAMLRDIRDHEIAHREFSRPRLQATPFRILRWISLRSTSAAATVY